MAVNKDSDEVNYDANYKDWSEAVSLDLQQLAVLHDREADETLIAALREVNFPYNLGFQVMNPDSEKADTDSDVSLSPQEFVEKSLSNLPEKPDLNTLDWLAVDYADIYLNHTLHASPYESVWLDEDHLTQQEPMFKVREWYQRYGVETEDWRIRSDDHIALQLQFMALLLDPAATFSKEIPLQKRLEEVSQFMDEHLLLWLADFSFRVTQRAGTEFYASVAHLTHVYIDQLRDALADITQITRPTADEVEKRLRANQPVIEEPLSFMPGISESW